MFNNLFEALVPVINAGLSALYKKVFATVLAATGNPIAAKLAAEAALIALIPAIQALQEAIQLLAAEVVAGMLSKVEDLIRDTVDNNDSFSSCAGTQFNAALVNSIIDDIDTGMLPLLGAIAKILSGGFDTANNIRSTVDLVRSFAGGLTGPNQGGNKCGGLVKEYVFGAGPKDSLGDVLDNIMDSANMATALAGNALEVGGSIVSTVDQAANFVQSTNDTASAIVRQFGDFPFLSGSSGKQSFLDNCSTAPPETCYGPDIYIFGGRGEGATATANVGNYVDSEDGRTVTNKQGGVVSIEVTNGGDGYKYPPFVEIRDNCKLGRGANARSVVKDGKVVAIYIVTPGEGYVATDDTQFVVDEVIVTDGGRGYTPGTYSDNYGGTYQVTVDSDTGTVTEILPTNYVQIPGTPTINIPRVFPPIPPGGRLEDREDDLGNPIKVVITADGRSLGKAIIGNGLKFRPLLVVPPTAEQVAEGDISDNLTPRLLQTEVINVVDCPD